jgi:uracil-DNA glycosylase
MIKDASAHIQNEIEWKEKRMLLNEQRSSTWNDLFNEKMIEDLERIEMEIGDDYTPSLKNVLRFTHNNLDEVKVCIIGQDPYFSLDGGDLVANGRAFQPNNLMDWSQKYKQVSLKNIVRLIYKNYSGITKYKEIKKYSEVVDEIKKNAFEIKPPGEWFDSLEHQGVLLLNRYLTTKVGTANAHRKIWEAFMADVFKYIDQKRPDMIWFLWGKEAHQCSELLKNGVIYKSRHPMMCSEKYEDDFLKAECFEKTMDKINWLG